MTAAAHSSSTAPRAPCRAAECEDFLVHEARLLDEARFDEWLALFTPKAHYWVPSEPNQQSPLDTVSLMYDDRRLLETRVRRLGEPAHLFAGAAFAHQPHRHQCHDRRRCQRRLTCARNSRSWNIAARAAAVRRHFLPSLVWAVATSASPSSASIWSIATRRWTASWCRFDGPALRSRVRTSVAKRNETGRRKTREGSAP